MKEIKNLPEMKLEEINHLIKAIAILGVMSEDAEKAFLEFGKEVAKLKNLLPGGVRKNDEK